MVWDETTQERYRRNAERYESDLTDGGPVVTGSPGRRRTPTSVRS